MAVNNGSALAGSSPHMRGTPSAGMKCWRPPRIIPAYAGNTGTLVTPRCESWDHPRICGEHMPVGWNVAVSSGSSPHMRGTRCTVLLGCRMRGIIPAYAGNTTLTLGNLIARGDHPRICGEHSTPSETPPPPSGSSPHMRGTHRNYEVSVYKHGIIPAYAGNTALRLHLRTGRRDHPRICGEHIRHPLSTLQSSGSSPHMRGTRFRRPS